MAVLGAKGELPNLKLPEGSKELKDEKAVRLCELIDVVGAAVGIRAYHRASGLSMPTLSPVPAEDKAPLFQRVTDFCSSGLTWDSISWGPRLEAKDLNLDVYKRLGMERTKQFVGITSPYAPASKWEPALTTAYDWFQWSLDAYPPNHDFFRLLGDFHKEGAAMSSRVQRIPASHTKIHCPRLAWSTFNALFATPLAWFRRRDEDMGMLQKNNPPIYKNTWLSFGFSLKRIPRRCSLRLGGSFHFVWKRPNPPNSFTT
ncbi:unnamed protein product [Effrenium voratum]|uniref:Uncharacterized protein n=1 Tax=Effrenium voratum TaxID=2562239 RepID=A0AA36N8Y1_9DINO|nr:unnamed protein product [Effrenium voratum]